MHSHLAVFFVVPLTALKHAQIPDVVGIWNDAIDENELTKKGEERPYDWPVEEYAQAYSRAGLASAGGDMSGFIPGCKIWNAYYWPQSTFWAQEMWRRSKVINEDDVAQLVDFRNFALKAAYLGCVGKFDPRKGTKWSDPATQFMEKVARAPDNDFKMPPLDEFFLSRPLDMMVPDACFVWSSALNCDIAWWSTQMKGSKQYNDSICWDQVQWPGWGFTAIQDVVVQMGRDKFPGDPKAQTKFPEYSTCLETPLNETILDSICPLGGHYAPGTANVEHWGHQVPKENQHEVTMCHKALGQAAHPKVNNADNRFIGAWHTKVNMWPKDRLVPTGLTSKLPDALIKVWEMSPPE